MQLGMELGLGPGDFVLDADPPPLPKQGAEPSPIFGPCLLWPNGWMDQDGTWRRGGPRSSPHSVRWGPSCPFPQNGQRPSSFGPFLLWPNGWMDKDATWYGGRPRPRRLCVRCGPTSPPQTGGRALPQFSAHVYCGQTAGWIKMALGAEVGFGPVHIMLDGDPAAPSPKWAEPFKFRSIAIGAKRLDG